MRIPIISGIYAASAKPELRVSYPRNLMPTVSSSGVNSGYLQPAEGLANFGAVTPGADRAAIVWAGVMYRVSDTKLIRVEADGSNVVLGDVGGSLAQPAIMDYSFDRLAVCSGGQLFYYLGSGPVVRVTDADLGVPRGLIWVDGYFMTHDGSSLVVTELTDPAAVNPLKYGSSEADPDRIVALVKLRREVHVCNRYTIEVFQNFGGDLFPFRAVPGAQVPRGAIGPRAACVFQEAVAFLGSGRNEAPGVYIEAGGISRPLSTPEVDRQLAALPEAELEGAIVEARVTQGRRLLYVHLQQQTLVYDAAASEAFEQPVWFSLTTSLMGAGRYRANNFLWCYGRWIGGDPLQGRLCELVETASDHYGELNAWEFATLLLYAEGEAALIHELELIALTGRVAAANDPLITTSWTRDGVLWSLDRSIRAGRQGQLTKRLAWRQQGELRHIRAQRFRGTSDAHISFLRLEAALEPLNRRQGAARG